MNIANSLELINPHVVGQEIYEQLRIIKINLDKGDVKKVSLAINESFSILFDLHYKTLPSLTRPQTHADCMMDLIARCRIDSGYEGYLPLNPNSDLSPVIIDNYMNALFRLLEDFHIKERTNKKVYYDNKIEFINDDIKVILNTIRDMGNIFRIHSIDFDSGSQYAHAIYSAFINLHTLFNNALHNRLNDILGNPSSCFHRLNQLGEIPVGLFNVLINSQHCADRLRHKEGPYTGAERLEVIKQYLNAFFEMFEYYYCDWSRGPRKQSIYNFRCTRLERLKTKARENTKEEIKRLKSIYDENLYVESVSFNFQLNRFINCQNASLLVTSKTGYGKTCHMCNLATRFYDNNIVLFLNTDSIPFEKFEDTIISLLNIEGVSYFSDIIELMEDEKLIFLLDGINQHTHPTKAFYEVNNLIEKYKNYGTKIKFVISYRDFDLYNPDVTESIEKIEMPPFNIKELSALFHKYSNRYGLQKTSFDDLSKTIKNFFKQPLLINLTCRSRNKIPKQFTESELINNYINFSGWLTTRRSKEYHSYTKSDLNKMELLFIAIAEIMYESNVKSITYHYLCKRRGATNSTEESEIIDLCKYLIREGFLLEREGKIEFAFSWVQEHILAHYIFAIKADEKDKDLGLVVEIAEKNGNESINNAYKIFLKNILRQDEHRGWGLIEYSLDLLNNGKEFIAQFLFLLDEDQLKPILDQLLDKQNYKERYFPILEHIQNNLLNNPQRAHIDKISAAYLERPTDIYKHIEGLLWRADVLYNRFDKYEEAKELYKDAITIMSYTKIDPDIELEAQYMYGRVLSDSGAHDDARGIAVKYINNIPAGERSRRRALMQFLLYMIDGDASGYFEKAMDYLDEAEQIFNEVKDQYAIGRVLINKAIAKLFTERSVGEAIKACEAAIQQCKKNNDYQGEAYAYLNLASFLSYKAHLILNDFGEIGNVNGMQDDPRDLIKQCENTLLNAETISNIILDEEEYISQLLHANIGMTHLIKAKITADNESELNEAAEAFNKMNQLAKKSDDWFNKFDSECLITGEIMVTQTEEAAINNLKKLFKDAKKTNYDQGVIRVYHYLNKYNALDKNSCADYNRALDNIPWARDNPFLVQNGPFYAGIFI